MSDIALALIAIAFLGGLLIGAGTMAEWKDRER